MAGDFYLAYLNKSLTFLDPVPTNTQSNYDPLRYKNVQFASLANALAINVFPVPGGPTNKIPFGSFAPAFLYLFEFFRQSTISSN